jgi:hypothetical protein
MRKPYEYLRAAEYLLNYIFLERPRGLNFSLRDLSIIHNAQHHGFAMTSDRSIKNIKIVRYTEINHKCCKDRFASQIIAT